MNAVRAKLVAALLAGALTRGSAAEQPLEEYRVKGAFLINFAKFVEWPAQAFKGPGDPLSICVLGASPFPEGLELAARDVKLENRTVDMRRISDVQQARRCQIVFVSVSERKRARAVLDAVQAESVLTVGESEGFIASGGVIEFRVEESKVKMEISEAAAKRAGLRISAKLLSLAQAGKKAR